MQGPTGTLACSGCGATWPAATARFCGSCGAQLSAAAADAPSGRSASRRSVVLLGAGGIVAALLGVTSMTGWVATSAWAPAPDPSEREVVLPDGGVAADPPLASAPPEGDASRTPTAARGLWCLPAGCDAWRRAVDPDDEVVGGSGLVVILGADGLTVLDGASGEVAWTDRLGDLVPVTGDGDRIGGLRRAGMTQVEVRDRGVFVTIGHRVGAFDHDGQRRWLLDLGDWQPDALTVIDDLLVLQRWDWSDAERAGRIAVVDVVDGLVRWEREATNTNVVASSGIVVETGGDGAPSTATFVSLDPRTGETQWEQPRTPEAWLASAGPWVLVHGPSVALLDARSGQEVEAIGGRLVQEPVAVGDRWVLVVDRGGVPSARELVGADAEGEILWRIPAPRGGGCCVEVLAVAPDTVVVGHGDDRLAIETVTGQRLPWDPEQIATSVRTLVWVSSDGARFDVGHDGRDTTITVPDGSRFTVPGGVEWWFASLEDPWVLGGPDELLGVRPVPGG